MKPFDLWWKDADFPEEVKIYCRVAWEMARDNETDRCGILAETYPFSPHIGKSIAALIYKGAGNE